MKTLIFNSISIIILFSISSNNRCNAQNLIESRQTSYYTYIYKISDKEAHRLYRRDRWKPDANLLHTLTDSFRTGSEYDKILSRGHYIKTYAERNTQKLFITSVYDFEVYIFNNNTDLCVQVFDLKGNRIGNAIVSTGLKRLRFDRKLQAYVDKKSNQKGLLKVSYDGFTAYYNLSRQYNNPAVKRATLKLIYRTPAKYVWMPVNYLIHLPVDGVKSIVKGWPEGRIYRTKSFINRISNSLFNPYYSSYKFRSNHKGYIVFNKPMYLPGDTVKFKSYIVTDKGKPVNTKLKVVLNNNRKEFELTTLQPYQSGGYHYEFFLHDSLKLELDRNYTVSLKKNDRKEYINGSFRYEDYELTKINLSLTADKEKHYVKDTIRIYATGTDENGLKLRDARLEVLVTPKSIDRYFMKGTFIPDTLLYFEKRMESENPTKIVIQDSLFPPANFSYTVNVRMLNSNNESVSESKDFKYLYDSEKFDAFPEKDSIRFVYMKNGNPQSITARVIAKDNFGNKTQIYEGLIPCKQRINPIYSSYFINSDSIQDIITMSDLPSLLQCYSQRTHDSVHIFTDNPRGISFMYNIYQKNEQKATGSGTTLDYNVRTNSRQNYLISIRYIWGGQVKEENYRIPYNDKKLNISATQPKIIYPGQKTKIDLHVTDMKGRPVEGVDITAFSITSAFNYTPVQVPYLGREKSSKRIINNFSIKDNNLNHQPGLNLEYRLWKIIAGLDSIEYYRFIYPENNLYRYEYFTEDSITQFSPFVICNGGIIPVHVIYADRKPVYFSWSTNIQPYSFRIGSGFHQIEIRTSSKSFILDSVYFRPGMKTILSIDYNTKNAKISINEAQYKLSDDEKQRLYNYIVPYKNNFGERLAYIENKGNIQLLNPNPKQIYYGNNYAGPWAGDFTYHLIDSFTTKSVHDPLFEYEFLPGQIKMRRIDTRWNTLPTYLYYNPKVSLNDKVLTGASIQGLWKERLDSLRIIRIKYRNPDVTDRGSGRLEVDILKNEKQTGYVPLNILLFKLDQPDFLRIYPGNARLFHQLDEGFYKLVFFYSGSKYHFEDSIHIRPNGLNHFEFISPVNPKSDSFSIYVSSVIENALFKPAPEKGFKQISQSYRQQFKYTGNGEILEGYVNDEKTGEALPGVNVFIKGTSYGTVTDLNGYYSLKIPPGYKTLDFSYIGYIAEERSINSAGVLNVTMKTDILQMQEVVVVGYGARKRSEMTGSVTTIVSNDIPGYLPGISGVNPDSLQGKVSGVSITGNPGGSLDISIRGSSAVSFDNPPLIIVNGNIYTGDITQLDPSVIRNIQVMKDAQATAIYGSQAVNGVILIETDSETYMPSRGTAVDERNPDETFFESIPLSSSIRKNFSDYAFWQPKLITDNEGKASFEVTFPDDITSWKTYYLAMNENRQSGQSSDAIKSYKPLMAQLAVPRFMIQDDTAYAIGKILNYTPDSVNLETIFDIDGMERNSQSFRCGKSAIDTFQICVEKDSLLAGYSLKTTGGYIDGEERTISVFPKGLEEKEGSFNVLVRDTTFKLNFNSNLGEVKMYARADVLEIIEDEIEYLTTYRYACNEQLASKLKALCAKKTICKFKNDNFKNEGEIQKVIRLLIKNQKENGLWGWWSNSQESLWISMHVLEALSGAEKIGYRVSLDKNKIIDLLIWNLQNTRNFDERVRILGILILLDSKINYEPYINDLEKCNMNSLNELLHVIELRKMSGMPYSTDTIRSFKDSTIFGNVFFKDENERSSIYSNRIQNTLMAYRILKADSTTNNEMLDKIRLYFLEQRHNGRWTNTYESARIVETILPGLLNNQSIFKTPVLNLKGTVNRTINEFPFEMTLSSADSVQVQKSGDAPVYLTTYQEYWNPRPVAKKSDFEIKTGFDDHSSKATLAAGKETQLSVYVKLKKDAEYLMIRVPIPAGCSYADKRNKQMNEVHREYFRNETVIFCENLSAGEYTYGIDLVSRYPGTYTLNPAKIELMYFPTFNANNDIETVVIK